MKVLTTLTTETELTVDRAGTSVGTLIDNLIAQSLETRETVSNISVEISPEDWIALRLLKSPVQERAPSLKPVRCNRCHKRLDDCTCSTGV